MWKNFTTDEVVNPLFDDCPAKTWQQLSKNIQDNLIYVMELVQALRDFTGLKIRLNSTYRPKSRGSAHSYGKAVDLQFINGTKQDYLNVMNWLASEYCPYVGFRAFLEWSGGNKNKDPWIHLDRNFRDKGGKYFYAAYPNGGIYGRKMNYVCYDGRLPQDYV